MMGIFWNIMTLWYSESSHPEMFCKKGSFRNFAKFTGKHLCQSFVFNKVAGLVISNSPFLTARFICIDNRKTLSKNTRPNAVKNQ